MAEIVDLWFIGDVRIIEVTMWAAMAAAVVTAGLLVAAIVAGLRIGRQIGLLEKQVAIQDKARHDAMKPVVRIDIAAARAIATDGTFLSFHDMKMTASVKNVGVGPARGIAAKVWMQPVALDWKQPDPHPRAAELGKPTFTATADSLGAGDVAKPHAVAWNQVVERGPTPAQRVAVYWTTTCVDVFDDEHREAGTNDMI